MGKGKSRQPAAKPEGSRKNANLEFILQQGITLLKRGEVAAAEVYFRQLLTADPRHLDALQLLGVIEYQKGQFEDAAELLQRALNMAPDEPGLLCNLGLTLQQLGRLDQALAPLERALLLKPDSVEALNNRGNVLRELKRMDEAAASYQQALRHRPGFVEALYNLGLTLLDLDKPEDGLACLARCLRAAPQHTSALRRFAVALMALKRPAEALDYFRRVLALSPDDAEAHCGLGGALIDTGSYEEAMSSYRRAVHLRPDIPETHFNLGTLLLDRDRPDEALNAFNQALLIQPEYTEALYNKGAALEDLHRFEEASVTYETLMAHSPDHRYTLGKLFSSRQFSCDWTNYAENVDRLVCAFESGKTPDMPFSFLAVSQDPALQLRCAQGYTTSRYPPSSTSLWSGQNYRHERIRIAYVSADFREHPLCYLLAGVFEAHDREQFETYALALKAPDGSPMEQRVKAAFDHFIDVSTISDADAAALIRNKEIDIAVHLTGYTQNNRSSIFAARPAPLQVNYLGFPATMGADYIDYILADEFVIPEESRRNYSEQIAYLPDCFQANDDRRMIAEHVPGRTEVGLPEDGFVFCTFNTINKLNPVFFAIWMRLLTKVPDSVLWLATDDIVVQRNLRAEAERDGVAPHRLVFAPRIAYAGHLARIQLADLFLDTLPFNAGTTASDALWAGVPVLTCTGEAFAARMAGSLLQTLGLSELITDNLHDYEALALKLATTPTQMAAIRAKLADRRLSSPLFDSGRFCRHLEAAYLGMWENHQRGDAPKTLKVAPIDAPLWNISPGFA